MFLDWLRLGAGRWTGWLQWAASESEKTVKVKGGLHICEKSSAHTDKTTEGERGPGSSLKAAAAAAQQTQPWRTSRSKGSSGSSKKFSKAKRCVHVTRYFILWFSPVFVTLSAQSKRVWYGYDRDYLPLSNARSGLNRRASCSFISVSDLCCCVRWVCSGNIGDSASALCFSITQPHTCFEQLPS